VWDARHTGIAKGERVVLERAGRELSFREMIAGLKDDADFRAFFIGEIAATPNPAFFWETPPLTRETLDRVYEHVVIPSEALERMPVDTRAFESILESGERSVATFRNLGGDALLVAPKMLGRNECYGHLGAFVRIAPSEQIHEFFRTVAVAIEEELRTTRGRIWVSTSGLGIAWLHVRLDTYPKYYNHRPYAEERG